MCTWLFQIHNHSFLRLLAPNRKVRYTATQNTLQARMTSSSHITISAGIPYLVSKQHCKSSTASIPWNAVTQKHSLLKQVSGYRQAHQTVYLCLLHCYPLVARLLLPTASQLWTTIYLSKDVPSCASTKINASINSRTMETQENYFIIVVCLEQYHQWMHIFYCLNQGAPRLQDWTSIVSCQS